MCNPKMLLLKKTINKPSFENPEEKITLNRKWAPNNILVKILPAGAKKQQSAGDDTNESLQKGVDRERCHVIDGAIVKIMKTNKDTAVKHADLVKRTMEMI